MKSVSIIIPAFNEEACLQELAHRLRNVIADESAYHWEVVIIDNGSTDRTWEEILSISAETSFVRGIKLSRNFLMDGGITAGLDVIDSDACVLMCADLQDPPELIPDFLRKWEEGYENIYGVVTERQGTNLLRRINSILFYKIAELLTHVKMPRNASDFRLVDRKVYEAVRSMKERNRFMRGLFAWVGFKSIGVEMVRAPRFGGVSNAHTKIVLELALRGVLSNSHKLLRLISYFGLGLSLVSFFTVVPMAIIWFTVGVPFAGFGTIVALILLGIGLQSLMIGILSEYVGLIYEESKARPNFIDSEKHNFQ
ncbi:MAG: glycosyltransferase family 2 protein [Actinobacteria bacterium]|nr:glycosyltransferase family 2 protein [Actinomycetota bacterium]